MLALVGDVAGVLFIAFVDLAASLAEVDVVALDLGTAAGRVFVAATLLADRSPLVHAALRRILDFTALGADFIRHGLHRRWAARRGLRLGLVVAAAQQSDGKH